MEVWRYYTLVPSRTIRHPYGLKAEIDIEPRNVTPGSPATQTVRIQVDKTCESISGWCHAEASNGWLTFDEQPNWNRFFDPQDGKRSLWTGRSLSPIRCIITLVVGILAPQQEPETVTVRLEARDDSERPVFGEQDAVIKVTIGY